MNWLKANMKVCRALSKGEKVCGHELGENTYLVTVDGVYAYLFPKKEIHFNLNDVRKLTKPIIPSLDVYLHGYDLRPTRVCLDLEGLGLVRKFEGKDYSVWIKSELLLHFFGTKFCQSISVEYQKLPVSPVLVVEADNPVGLILPVRVLDGMTIRDAESVAEFGGME